MIKLVKKIIKDIKIHSKNLFELKTSPHSIALGFSIGTFIALLPTFGFGALIGLFILLFTSNLNKISLLSSFIIWNPLILAPFYFFSYKIGSLIYPTSEIIELNLKFKDLIFTYSKTFLIGNLILSFSVSLLCYFLIQFIFNKYYKFRHIKITD